MHHDNSDNSKLPPINSFSAQIFMGLLWRNWRSICCQELLREDKDTRGLSVVKLYRSTAFLVVSNNWNDIEIPSQSFYFFLNLARLFNWKKLDFPPTTQYIYEQDCYVEANSAGFSAPIKLVEKCKVKQRMFTSDKLIGS